jgi:hypothetical protein
MVKTKMRNKSPPTRTLCTSQQHPTGSPTNSAFTWRGFAAAPWTSIKHQWTTNQAVIKNYGKFAVVLYFTIYLTTLGTFYSAVHFKIIRGKHSIILLQQAAIWCKLKLTRVYLQVLT